jgi:GT2 family glycosyltransferase
VAQSKLNVISEIEHQKGLSYARNKGASLTRGKYIAFTDDDCYPETDYIDAISQSIHGNPDVGFIGGKVLLFDQNDFPITIQTFNEMRRFPKDCFLEAGAIHGANFIFKREALMSAHMFDPRLGAGTQFPSEDVDALAEVLRLGWPGIYDPSIVVYHHHRRKSESDASALMINYDWGRGAYYAKRIFKPGQRWLYLKTWIKIVIRQPLAVTRRELIAAIHFWLKSSSLKKQP